MTLREAGRSDVRDADDGRVDKPWGYELRWAVTDRYLGKVIHINKGQQLSLQYHVQKDESILIMSGLVDLVLEDERGEVRTHRMPPGMTARVRPGRRHRFVAVEESDIVEVSSPEIDDVVRLEDSYGRQGTSTA
jgi:mannose-6-phosphate isomerase